MTTIVVNDPSTQKVDQTPDPQTDVSGESDLPEKYRGKSAKEIVEIARNLESELGRKNNEVGSLRRLTDQVLGLGLQATARAENQTTNQKTRQPLTTEDVLADPEKSMITVAKEVADERVSANEKRTANLEAQLNYDRFQRANPDFEKTVNTDEFKNWVNSSSYRQRLVYRAAQNDWDAAQEVLGLYESSKPAQTQTETPDPKAAAKAAGLAKRGGSSAAGVAGTSDGKKIYSRTELIDMRIKDPEGYEARYTAEFLPAYREGRVR